MGPLGCEKFLPPLPGCCLAKHAHLLVHLCIFLLDRVRESKFVFELKRMMLNNLRILPSLQVDDAERYHGVGRPGFGVAQRAVADVRVPRVGLVQRQPHLANLVGRGRKDGRFGFSATSFFLTS